MVEDAIMVINVFIMLCLGIFLNNLFVPTVYIIPSIPLNLNELGLVIKATKIEVSHEHIFSY